MSDPEFEDIYRQLSVPADQSPGAVTRRRFLQGMAVTGSVAMLPNVLARAAEAVTPIGARDGVLVLIQMGGGNDGLNMVCPVGEAAYYSRRRNIAIPKAQALPIGTNTGMALHPNLKKLKARYDKGKVAIVRGVGQTNGDHSHFSSTANWMAGTSTSDRSSGWLGRYLDGVPEATAGLRGVTVGTSVPLTLLGRQSVITAVPPNGDGLFGADRSEPWDSTLYDAIGSFGAATTGRGRWADAIGAAEKEAMGTAKTIAPLYTPALPDGELLPQMVMAARLLNANLGIRILNVSFGSFDTHDGELYPHGQLMAELDAAVEAFFTTLQAKWADRVTVMTFSEFGRRAESNDSGGTDHGTAAPMLVIGDHVKGGLAGQQPLMSDLDSRGDLKVKVDFRSVYASVLGGWLGADAKQVLGATYPTLDLFTAGPGAPVVVPPPPPPVDTRWLPFATATQLVQQQYLDFLARAGDAGGVSYWSSRLAAGTSTIGGVIEFFVNSPEFGDTVRPAARLALACTNGAMPTFEQLVAWSGQLRAGTSTEVLAATIFATPAAVARYGAMGNREFATVAFRDILGRAADAAFVNRWTTALGQKTEPRSELVREVAEGSENQTRSKAPVDVLATYLGMLRRAPDAGGYAYWVDYARKGNSLRAMTRGFFGSPEYASRFS